MWLSWAVSTLPMRLQRGNPQTAAACALQILVDLAGFFDADDCPYTQTVVEQRAYGSTMHYFAVAVRPREWAPPIDTPEFDWRPRLMYTDA